MGKYIPGPLHGKAPYLVEKYNAKRVLEVPKFEDIPTGQMLICVVDNVAFEAAGWADSPRELKEFSDPYDTRQRTWLLIEEKYKDEIKWQ